MLAGVTARVCGRSPLASVEPTTSPPLTPPPPSRQNIELPQWSRPGVPLLPAGPPLPPSFIFGVRLNSPHRTTRVRSSRPRSDRSGNSDATAASTIGRGGFLPALGGPWGAPP